MRFLFVNTFNNTDTPGINEVGFTRDGETFKEYVFRDGGFQEVDMQFWDNEDDYVESHSHGSKDVIDVELASEEEAMKFMGGNGEGLPPSKESI